MLYIYERLMESKAFVSGILFALLISVIFNGFLVIQIIQLDNQLNQGIEQDETTSNSEAIVSSLERENKALRNQLNELVEGNIDVEEIDIDKAIDNVESDRQIPEIIIDEKLSDREELTTFTSEFVSAFLTQNEDVDQNRRENLAPYLASHLLDTLVPVGEEIGNDLVVEHGDVEETFEGEMKYSVELIDQSIYIDETSLGKDLQNVLVYVTTQTTVNNSSPTNERSIIDIRMNKNDEGLEINNIYFRYLNDDNH